MRATTYAHTGGPLDGKPRLGQLHRTFLVVVDDDDVLVVGVVADCPRMSYLLRSFVGEPGSQVGVWLGGASRTRFPSASLGV